MREIILSPAIAWTTRGIILSPAIAWNSRLLPVTREKLPRSVACMFCAAGCAAAARALGCTKLPPVLAHSVATSAVSCAQLLSSRLRPVRLAVHSCCAQLLSSRGAPSGWGYSSRPAVLQIQVAKLVSAASDGTSYSIEYTIQKGSAEQKHLYSRVIMGSNGRFRRFYTITATCPESQVAELGPTLKSAVASLNVQNLA
jgi:PsbP